VNEELQELMNSNPEWYKNLQYDDVKVFIKANLNNATRCFVVIGYYLKYARDNVLFKEDNYSGILEFAQVEFGISKSWASKWMSINDKFSVDGNSPILLEQYRDFSSSKLSEMLYLTDEQLEQVTITTTKAEIREIKSPVKEEVKFSSFSPAKTEEGPSSPLGYKKSVYPPASLIASKGCGNKHSCFSCSRICQIRQDDRYCVDAPLGHPFSCTTMNVLDSIENDVGSGCMFINLELAYHRAGDHEPAPCCKECKSKCGYTCGKAAHQVQNVDIEISNPTLIDDLELSVRTYNCLKRAGIDTVEKLCELQFQEIVCIRNISMKIIGEINEKLIPFGLKLNLEDRNYEDTIVEDHYPEELIDEVEDITTENNEWKKPEVGTYIYDVGGNGKITEYKVITQDCGFSIPYREYFLCEGDEEGPVNISAKSEHWYYAKEEAKKDSWYKGDEIASGLEHDKNPTDIVSEQVDIVSETDKTVSEPVEVVQADIIQTEPEDKEEDEELETIDPEHYTWRDVDDELDKLTEYVELYRKNNDTALGRRKSKMRYDAIVLLDKELKKKPVVVKEPELNPIQPELPILKNNDQRTAFVDAYETWPVWIETKETEERYYRYDLSDNASMVVKVYYSRLFDYKAIGEKYEDRFKDGWGKEEYYLLKPEKHFRDCETNKSALIDYLKEVQKK